MTILTKTDILKGDIQSSKYSWFLMVTRFCVCPLCRYEYQGDNSLLGDYQFIYDDGWFKSQTLQCLKFWMGEREAGFVSKDERWKCGFCSFAGKCPMVNSQESQLENELPKDLYR